jgi:hypothetical protein
LVMTKTGAGGEIELEEWEDIIANMYNEED